jgi:Asp-tRNA(Asn)/Glu-tRNA(Gln) amidotransferase C subunit
MDKSELKNSLNKLEEIINWFDNQEEVDVEGGLEKVREGVTLIKSSRERLKKLSNEFEEVKKELDEDELDNDKS